ncbi:MAG TPA: hypothetical protein VL485_23980 [Ktedonobacteraceae bacterium]|jgi:hypothetical protein|nr:hypothetical protein [Ktedonobacteraceae bacterium]
MKRLLSARIARWWVVSLVAGVLVLSSFTFSSTHALAAACNIGIALDASGGSASCDMSIQAQVTSGVYTFSADSSATVPDSPFTLSGTPILANFHFSGIIRDHRGNTNGGRGLASSSGITNGSTTLPLSITSVGALSCTNGTCAPPTFIPVIPLTTTPQTFVTGGNAAHTIIVDGDYTGTFDGQFTIPPGSPSGVYSGIIMLTLTNIY